MSCPSLPPLCPAGSPFRVWRCSAGPQQAARHSGPRVLVPLRFAACVMTQRLGSVVSRCWDWQGHSRLSTCCARGDAKHFVTLSPEEQRQRPICEVRNGGPVQPAVREPLCARAGPAAARPALGTSGVSHGSGRPRGVCCSAGTSGSWQCRIGGARGFYSSL